MLRTLLLICLISILQPLHAQRGQDALSRLFKEVTLRVDTMTYSLDEHGIVLGGDLHLPFEYQLEEKALELRLTPRNPGYFENRTLKVLPSGDYDILDSVAFVNDSYYRLRVRFRNLSTAELTGINWELNGAGRPQTMELKLLPYTRTRAIFYPGNDDLYIGEEKRFELVTSNLSNLRIDGEWKQQGNMEYRLFTENNTGYISVVAKAAGEQSLRLSFQTLRPFLDDEGQLQYALAPQEFAFNVRGSRLSFLRPDQREIVLDREQREGVEIQIENHRSLYLNKTYRIEDREEPGGPLIAELYTLRNLSNDRVLCVIRPYHYHRTSEGYLFIKDGDVPRFLTNINIVPEVKVTNVLVLREGQNWTSDRSVRPGETLEIRLEGESLNRARIHFEDLQDVSPDSLVRNDRVLNFRLQVPLGVRKRSINIYHDGKTTGFSLEVKEYERPRPLDFVRLQYNDRAIPLNEFTQTVLHRHTIRDIVVSFDPAAIDTEGQLYGRQFLEIDVRITGTRDELVETHKIEGIVICPEAPSPRAAFYQSNQCDRQEIRLNSLLSRKTHSLDHWSRIELTIRHKADRYSETGYTQRVVIVLQRLVTFDVDVSFPAGLVVKRIGVDGFPGLGGISLAMLAQFTFYDKERIRHPKPYKIGAGFLAQNAFNFNPEVQDRDLGIVILGSLYPLRQERKLNFPLYGGFGYFLNEDRFFFLIGPGIRVNF
jgi:hypothetical protein